MDQSVIEAMKRRYRKKFIQRLVAEEEISLIDYWKSYNMKNVVYNASDAWADVSNVTLKRAWNKLWPQTAESNVPEPNVSEPNVPESNEINVVTNEILAESNAVFSLESENDIVNWLQCDDKELGYQLFTDEEIVEMVTEEENPDPEIDDDYDGGEAIDFVFKTTDSRKEAKQAASNMDNFIDWYERQEDANQTDSMILRRLRNLAFKKSEVTKKQTKVTEFFGAMNIE